MNDDEERTPRGPEDAPEEDVTENPTVSYFEADSPDSGGEARTTGLKAGQRFGGYALIGKLGAGGSGEVWQAEHLETGRLIALKVLPTLAQASPAALQRFEREGRLAASLNHPRTVFVFGVDMIGGQPAISMELMPGGTLEDRLRSHGPLPYRDAVEFTLDILDGLEAAHRLGILHRDLKPSNCFVDEEGRGRLGDFGISRSVTQQEELTVAGAFLGTPVFSSPEQVKGRDLDRRSDYYALGATLYALLTGRPPFRGSQPGEVLARILSEPPEPFDADGPKIPRQLKKIVLRMMAKQPDRRYGTVAEIRDALRPWSSRGLTPTALARRAAAITVDYLLLTVLNAPITVAAINSRPFSSRWAGLLSATVAVWFLYFFFSEVWRGRTPGKFLFRLRVNAERGVPAPPNAVAARSAIFVLVTMVFPLPFTWLAFVTQAAIEEHFSLYATFMGYGLMLLQWSGAALLATSMRRSNGYAGLHELFSGTRVHTVRAVRDRLVPQGLPRPVRRLEETVPFGPYVAYAVLWEQPEERLLLAHDERLDRDVWIHTQVGDEGTVAPSSLARTRPGRLRWLQGSRVAGEIWDAYEGPEGSLLRDWTAKTGPLPWSSVHELLRGLTTEVDQSREERRGRLSLDRVWVDSRGRPRLLDFDWPRPEAGTAQAYEPDQWQAFLGEVVTGCLKRREGGRGPFPERARALVEELASGKSGYREPAQLLETLEPLGRLGSDPRPLQRLSLTLTLLIGLIPVLLTGFALLMLTLFPPWMLDLTLFEVRRQKLVAAERELGPEEFGRLVASFEIVSANAYRMAKGSAFGSNVLRGLARPVRNGLEEYAATVPEVSPRQIAEARVIVEEGLGSPTQGPRELFRRPWKLLLLFALFASLGAVPAILLAGVFRGSVLLRASGLAVQLSDGRRAGRLCCLRRAAIVWSPFLLAFVLGLSGVGRWPGYAAVAVAAAAFLFSFAFPERTPVDRITGTRIVNN